MIHINSFGNEIDKVIIETIETNLEISLPKDYVDFILKNDGGKPESNIVKYKDEYSKSCEASVRYFYAFSFNKQQFTNIKYPISTYIKENRIPKGYFPIACDCGGNLFCISTNENDYGSIYFWDHDIEVEEGEKPTMYNMHYICDSFTKLITQKMELYNEPIEKGSKKQEKAEVWIKPGSFIEKLLKEQNDKN